MTALASPTTTTSSATRTAAASLTSQAVIEVDASALPLYCPGPHAPLWSMHPRVFLDFDETGSARCPYCGAHYRLAPGAVAPRH